MQEIRAGVYTLTVSAPVEFLTDPATVYPVTIDPTITSKDTMEASNIEDATVFSGYPNNNFGNYVFNTIGYQDTTYGTGRVAVRLKALLADETYAGLSAEDISSVLFYMKDGGSNYTYVNIHALSGNSGWAESTVTNSNVGTPSEEIYATARMGGSAWTAFDLTDLAKAWKSGSPNGQCGFLMVIATEGKKIGALSCEYGSGDYWPYVVVNYEDDSVLNRAVVDIDKGATFTLTVENPNNLPLTWISDDQSVATVNGTATNCVVTGVEIGTTTVRVSSADGSINAKCKVYVTVADGVYYIKNASSGLCLQGTAGNTTIGAQRTNQETRLDQLWKIAHVGSGYYVIRPMKDFAAALTVNNSTYVAVGDAAVENDQVAIGSCWTITLTSSGYAFKRYGSNAQTVTPVVSGQPGSAVYAGTWSDSLACHWTLQEVDGLFFRDTETLCIIDSTTVFEIEVGDVSTLAQLGIGIEHYGASLGYWWTTSKSIVASVSDDGTILGENGGETTITYKMRLDNVDYTQHFVVRVLIPQNVYYIRNKEVSTYVQIDDVSAPNYTIEDSVLEVKNYAGSDYQQWTFVHIEGLYYKIISVASGLALTVYPGAENMGTVALVQREYSGADGQKWKIEATQHDAYVLRAKSAEAYSTDWCMSVGMESGVEDGYNVEQKAYVDDDDFKDVWMITPSILIGMSTDDYDIDGNVDNKRGSYHYANTFYSTLYAPKDRIHHYNYLSTRTASINDFSANGAISNSIDFMIYIGHGHAAHDFDDPKRGNHIHYNCAIFGPNHGWDDQAEEYTVCESSGNLYTENVQFGSDTSRLRWVWMYTCNFLTTGSYVTKNDLKAMMNGAHIVLGYASQSYLCDEMASKFSEYLREGMPIYDAYFQAGIDGEAIRANDNHLQRILYIPQARYETIYSPYIHYDYEPSDVQIIGQYIKTGVKEG